MNASELVAALRQETQTVANTEGASNVRLVLYYNDGTSKNCKLNPNGSWVQKPTATNGMVKFVWIDSTMAHSETVGMSYTVRQPYQVELVDPEKVSGFQIMYDVTTTTLLEVQEEQEGEGEGE